MQRMACMIHAIKARKTAQLKRGAVLAKLARVKQREAAMTQAMRFAKWLSAGEARHEPREQVASSVMLR